MMFEKNPLILYVCIQFLPLPSSSGFVCSLAILPRLLQVLGRRQGQDAKHDGARLRGLERHEGLRAKLCVQLGDVGPPGHFQWLNSCPYWP